MADEALLNALRQRVADPHRRASIPLPELPPRATQEETLRTETDLGFPLDPFLRRMYLEIANGGFGPGHGLLPLGSAATLRDPTNQTLSSVYLEFSESEWLKNILPLWDWGGGVWSCIDVDSIEGRIVTYDQINRFTQTTFALRSWLNAWLNDVDLWAELFEEQTVTLLNPFTKKPVTTKSRGRAKGQRLKEE